MKLITLSLTLLVYVIPVIYGSHFRGGSINWKPIGSNQIQLNYDVGFKLDHKEPGFDPCTADAQQTRTELQTSGKVLCSSCSMEDAVKQLTWICDDYDEEMDSSVGHNSLIYDIPPGLQEFDISHEHCCWIDLQSPIDRYGGAKGWKMLTHVNLQPRPDNGQINSSPVTAPIPVEKFYKGCEYLLRIPVSDPDGDAVRCRYADKSLGECPASGNTKACGPDTDGLTINKKSCTLNLNTAGIAEGYHAVNVVIEDYIRPVKRKSKPLSKGSLLFLLQVEAGEAECSKPTIVDPPSCRSIRPGDHFEMVVQAEAGDATKPISRIKSQKPYGMTSSDMENDPDYSGRMQITLSWDPTVGDIGEHTACVSALDSDRFTSGLSCTFVYVDDNPLQAIPEGSYPAINEEIGAGQKWVIQFNKQIKRPKVPAFIKIIDPFSGKTVYEVDAKISSVSFNETWIEFVPPKETLLSGVSTMDVAYQVVLDEGVALPRSSGCGSETLQWSVIVTDVDKEPPVIFGMPDDMLTDTDAALPSATVSWLEPTASDNSGSVTLTSSHAPGSSFPIGETTVTYTAVDDASNAVTDSFVVTVQDTEAPVILGIYGNMRQATDPDSTTAVVSWTEPTASDNSEVVTLTSSHNPGDYFPIGDTIVTYTAVDPAGNEASKSFTVMIEDKEAPVILNIPQLKKQAADPGSPTTTVVWTEPTVSDNSRSVTVTSTHNPGDSFPIGDTTVTYTAVDAAGNEATKSFLVTVEDGEAPLILDIPLDKKQATDPGAATAAVTWTEPTASDNSRSVTMTSSHKSGDFFPIGETTVTYTAVDSTGNKATESFTVTVKDDEAPAISNIPQSKKQSTDPGSPNAVVSWMEPTVSDNSQSVTMTSSHNPGDSFPIGDTTVTYTAIDAAGNEATESFTVTVDDDEAPVISDIPQNEKQSTDHGSPNAVVSWMEPTVSDNSRSVTVTSSHSSGDSFPIGDTTVTYTAIDAAGNEATESFVITVEDAEDPVIIGNPGNKNQATDPGFPTAALTWTEPTASDNSRLVTVTSNRNPGDSFPIGETTVTYTAVDPAGNKASEAFIITIQDTEDPVVLYIPGDKNKVTDPGLSTAVVSWTEPTGSDNSGSVMVSSSHTPGDSFPIGDTIVTYTATDHAGNTATKSFTVTVTDSRSPVIDHFPGDITQRTDPGLPTASVFWKAPSASDNSGSVILTSSHNPGDSFPIGDTTVTYTASDMYGNEEKESFTITVRDKEAPVISGLPGMIVQNSDIGSPSAVVSWPDPVPSDNSGFVTMTSSHDPGDTFPIGDTKVSYTAEDPYPNHVTISFLVTITDNEDPVISNIPTNKVQPTDLGLSVATVSWTPPISSDNSNTVTMTSSHNPGDSFPVGDTTVTYTATDSFGNVVYKSFTVTVYDNEPPDISGLSGEKVFLTEPGKATAIGSWSRPTATDNSGYVTMTSSYDPGSTFPIGGSTVTYTAVDPYGNQATEFFVVTVIDLEPPNIVNIPSNKEQNTDSGLPTATVSWNEPTASDNSGSVTVSSSHKPGDSFPIDDTRVTYTATDNVGNTNTGSFIVKINDNESPVISDMPEDIVQEVDGGLDTAIVSWTEPTAIDNSRSVTLASSHKPGESFPIGDTTVTYTAVDPTGNEDITSFTVTVRKTAFKFKPAELSVTTTWVPAQRSQYKCNTADMVFQVPNEMIAGNGKNCFLTMIDNSVTIYEGLGSTRMQLCCEKECEALFENLQVNPGKIGPPGLPEPPGPPGKQIDKPASIPSANQINIAPQSPDQPPGPQPPLFGKPAFSSSENDDISGKPSDGEDTYGGKNIPGGPPGGDNQPGEPYGSHNHPGITPIGQNQPGGPPGGYNQLAGQFGGQSQPEVPSGGHNEPGGPLGGQSKPGGLPGGQNQLSGPSDGQYRPGGQSGGQDKPDVGKDKASETSRPGCRVGHVDGYEGTGQGEDPGCKDQNDGGLSGGQDTPEVSSGDDDTPGVPFSGQDKSSGGKDKASETSRPGCRVGQVDGYEGTGRGEDPGCKDQNDGTSGGPSGGKVQSKIDGDKTGGKSSDEDKPDGKSNKEDITGGKSSQDDKSGGKEDQTGGKSSNEDKTDGKSNKEDKTGGKSSQDDKSGGKEDTTGGISSEEDKTDGKSRNEGKTDGKSNKEDITGGKPSQDDKSGVIEDQTGGKSSEEDKTGGKIIQDDKSGGKEDQTGGKSNTEDKTDGKSNEEDKPGGTSSQDDKSGDKVDKTGEKSSKDDKADGKSKIKDTTNGKSNKEDLTDGKSSKEDKAGGKSKKDGGDAAEEDKLGAQLTDLSCSAGWPIVNRQVPDSGGMTIVAVGQPIKCDGVVKKWQYRAMTSNPFRAIIWRPVSGSSTRFQVVGINDIPAGPINQEVIYVIPPSDRIEVQQGDLIGWSSAQGVLTRKTGRGDLVRWIGGNQYNKLHNNKVIDIDGGSGTRQYSIKATVGPNDDNNQEMYGFFVPEK